MYVLLGVDQKKTNKQMFSKHELHVMYIVILKIVALRAMARLSLVCQLTPHCRLHRGVMTPQCIVYTGELQLRDVVYTGELQLRDVPSLHRGVATLWCNLHRIIATNSSQGTSYRTRSSFLMEKAWSRKSRDTDSWVERVLHVAVYIYIHTV